MMQSVRHFVRFLLAGMLLCLLGTGTLHAAASGMLVTVAGARVAAELNTLTAEGQATFTVEGTRRVTPWSDLVSWGALVEPRRGVQVCLVGGGLLVVEGARSENEQLVIDSELFDSRSIPLEFVAGVMFQPPRDPQMADRLAARMLDGTARSDRVFLENGDELVGTIAALSATAVTIDLRGEKTSIELARIAAVALDPTLAPPAKTSTPRTLVGLRDGSRLLVTGLSYDGRQWRFTMPDRATWHAPADAVVALQTLGGQVVYLSDLPADSYRYVPFLGQTWPYRNDANVLGSRLRAGGHPYAKGIGMHSAARLTYLLDKRFHTFEADVALDDQVRAGGAATFAVYLDDKLAWKSDVIRGGMPPVPVKVETGSAKRLSLIVEFAEQGDELDHADWLNARLIE